MQPVRLPRAYMVIVDQIRRLIESGDLAPGDKLPTERVLAGRFEVSRSSMREALTALEVMGIIDSKPGLGNYVVHDLPSGLTEFELAGLITEGSTLEILEARKMLEPHVAALGAERRTDEDLGAMSSCIDEMARATAAGEDSWDPDWGFHVAVARSCQNMVVEALVDLLTQRMTSRLWRTMRGRNLATSEARAQRYLKDHELIYMAIRDQDAAAASSRTVEHLVRIASDLAESQQSPSVTTVRR
jgi:GntR family transcriptional regulator, transcriptional repressor for pyruvate dehydrogenase complex